MNLLRLVIGLGVFLNACLVQADHTSNERPNVLFISLDDMNKARLKERLKGYANDLTVNVNLGSLLVACPLRFFPRPVFKFLSVRITGNSSIVQVSYATVYSRIDVDCVELK